MTPREKFVAALKRVVGVAYAFIRTGGSLDDCNAAIDEVLRLYDEAARPVAAGEWVMGLQQRCVDWNVYWRAPDAHGVQLSIEQATELLQTWALPWHK